MPLQDRCLEWEVDESPVTQGPPKGFAKSVQILEDLISRLVCIKAKLSILEYVHFPWWMTGYPGAAAMNGGCPASL